MFSEIKGLFHCPNEECSALLSRQDIQEKDVFIPIPITEKDDQGRILSKEAFMHYSVRIISSFSC
jgi:hypothetical protein